jgi:hypothetical protein
LLITTNIAIFALISLGIPGILVKFAGYFGNGPDSR